MSEEKNIVTDNLGRQFKLKEIQGKTRIAFYRALGREDAANNAILGEYWPTMAIEAIDGEVQPSIKSLVDIEFLFEKMDKSNASKLISDWLVERQEEKARNEVADSKKA